MSSSVMLAHQINSGKQGFPLRLLAVAFVIGLLTAFFSGWELWQMHNRFEEISSRHITLTAGVGRIMLFDEVLTMSARMAAATGDSAYEERYDRFDPQLKMEIDKVRDTLPQSEMARFVGETDEANIALGKIERRAFALMHQGRRQEATALLSSDEFLRLKDVYAGGMIKTVNAANALIESDAQYLLFMSIRLAAAHTIGVLVLLAAWFFAARSARSWDSERREAEEALQKAHDGLEVRVKQRTADLLSTNEKLKHEISEHTAAKEKNQRLTQLYAALSQCNEAIVRCSSAAELFPQICRVAVQSGGMKMAWIGLVDDATQCVNPVAAFGDGVEYLERIRISVAADDPTGRGPTGTAIRDDQPYWCQDFQNDPSTAPWHEHGARAGWGSAASLPLRRNGVAIGTFTLYASEVDAFDEAARNLLAEMAMDVSYALDRFELMAQQKLIEDALSVSERDLQDAQRVGHIGSYISDIKSDLWKSSETLDAILGISEDYSRTVAGWMELVHPAHRDEMLSFLRGLITEHQTLEREFRIVRANDGAERWVMGRGKIEHDSDGNPLRIVGTIQDITERKQAEEHLLQLAHFDVLTGLPNRALFTDRINHALSIAQRGRTKLAVMFLDLDHFKNVNDSLGHRIGDALLIEVAKRLKSAMREEDTVSRQGGDEFILVLPGTDADGAAHAAEKIMGSISQPYRIEQHELVITPSIGIAMYPDDGKDFDALSKCADVAMYRAKQDGRNNYRFFTLEMQTRSARTLQLENALRHALEHDQLRLHYQPQMSLQDGRIIGAEALLRWQHPKLGAISPVEFIPIAEASGQILAIGEWVLRTAARQMKSWMDNGLEPMVIAVNLSAVQFRQPHLPELVTQILEEAKLPPQYLELELTEGVAMVDPLGAIAVMNDLYERGIRMSIDDFGTGYSSLSYLKRFKVYKLKIDQTFVRDITDNPEDKAIVIAIISLANSLGLQTIAEGVETSEQLALLRLQGCNEMQGYHFSKPLPAEQFEAFVRGKGSVARSGAHLISSA